VVVVVVVVLVVVVGGGAVIEGGGGKEGAGVKPYGGRLKIPLVVHCDGRWFERVGIVSLVLQTSPSSKRMTTW